MTDSLCHAFDTTIFGAYPSPVGDCGLPKGHNGWHQTFISGRPYVEWEKACGFWQPDPESSDTPTRGKARE